MSNLEIRLKNGREEITGKKLNKIGKEKNRIKYAAEQIVLILEKAMIDVAAGGGNSISTFGIRNPFAEIRRTESEKRNVDDKDKEVFERALKIAKEKYKGKGIKFKVKVKDSGRRKLMAEW